MDWTMIIFMFAVGSGPGTGAAVHVKDIPFASELLCVEAARALPTSVLPQTKYEYPATVVIRCVKTS